MQRLQKHQQKKYQSQIIGYLVLLIILIIFIATVGIKLLIGTAFFVINFTQKNNKTHNANTSSSTDIILPPEIFNIPTATNTAEITIQVRSTPEKKISFYVNDIKQKEITPEEETFEETITLDKGNNTLSLVMDDPTTKTKKTSRTYTIIYKDEKPTLEITSPHDLDKTSKNEIQIEGTTQNEVTIRINNSPIVVDSEGKFTYTMKLKEGENHIVVEAQDIADNRETKEMTIYYQKEN